MIRDGERGAVLQRDKKTYAVAPHLPCGLVTPGQLRKIADVAEKYHVAALKCTSAQRIAMVGIREEDVEAVWAEFGEGPENKPGCMFGDVVRSVKACPGTQFCKRARQDSLEMGLELDRRYHGKPMPGKLKIGVSGCPNQCAETCIKDIGLVGGRHGWVIYVGGSGGSCPKLAEALTLEELGMAEALEMVERILGWYREKAQEGERLGEVLDRMTIGRLRNALGVK